MSTGSSSNLGSLAQAARGKQLKSARNILLFVGILTVVANTVFLFLLEGQIDQAFEAEIAAARAQRMVVDQAEVSRLKSRALSIARVLQVSAILLGGVFIVLGVIVKKYPVPVTVVALVLYIGSAAVFGFIDPTTLISGIIIKLIIVFVLIKSIQSAVAYEREQKRQPAAPLSSLGSAIAE